MVLKNQIKYYCNLYMYTYINITGKQKVLIMNYCCTRSYVYVIQYTHTVYSIPILHYYDTHAYLTFPHKTTRHLIQM